MMSSKKARQTMLSSIKNPVNGPIIDLGSGWGTLVISAAQQHPNQPVIGYELSLLPWFVSVIRKHYLRLDNLEIHRKDFHSVQLGNAAILFCYLYPEGMTALYAKLIREKISNVVIISNTFALASCKPLETITLQDMYRTRIYIYHWPPS